MKRIKLRRIFFWVFILILFNLIFPNVSGAGGGDATFDENLSVLASPSQQGSGGPITITFSATFYGGCCYPLYGYDVQSEIILPKEFELIDPISPEKIDKFEATAGGGAVLADFKCTIRSYIPGEYVISLKVSTSNAGKADGKVVVKITEGCVISTPEIYPKQPSTERSTKISITAYSPIESVIIDKVFLYYVTMNSDNLKETKTENETFYFNGKTITGKSISFEPMEFEENQWQGEIPRQNKAISIVYWIVAEDNFGNKTTSPPNIIEVKNLNEIHFQHSMLIWGAIFGSVVGIIIIVLLWKFANRITFIRSLTNGFMLIGTSATDLKTNGASDIAIQRKMNRNRNIVLLILFFIALILILLAIFENQYELLRENVGG
jgi:hypothetical protein